MIQLARPEVIAVGRRPEPQGNQPPVSPSTPILYSDLTGKLPEEAELTEIIHSFNKTQTFFMLCAVNTLVSFFAHEFEDSIAVERFLQGNFIEPDLIQAIDKKLAGQSVLQHPLFHRQMLLALQRRVLLEAADEGGRDPNPETNREDRQLLGKACLMMNNFLFPREQEERLKNSGAAGEDERIYGELFAQWLATAEVLNPPNPVHSVVRHLEYAKVFDERYAAYAFGEGRTLAQRFQELTGIELKKFFIFLFNFDLYFRSHTRDELIGNMALFNVDIKTVFGKMKITEAEVHSFFKLLTNDVAGLMASFMDDPDAERPVQPQFDVRPFRMSPLVYRNDERTIVTCADPAFLQEKISSGAYHAILRALDVDVEVRNERDEADRKRFLKQYWGEVFEIYVNTRLRELYPLEANRFYASPKWDSPRAVRNNEAFDGFLDYGNAVIAMEYKGKYLSLTAKYSGNRELLLADLNERFGKATRQLAQRSETAFNRDPNLRHGFSQRDENNQSVLSYTVAFSRQVRRVYPIVIVQDPALRIGFANREMQKLFDAEIKPKEVDQDLIKPLTLLTIEDLEYLIPYLGEVTFPEILDEYLKPHEPLISFRYIMNQYLDRQGIAHRQNEWTMQRFDELRESLKELFVVFD